ncbi:unnamed protein product [Allacma fusca]|uniref:Uncharacterized protein n=1 Tax=Allacma fusca TaxID=39272 RepID=A0A8J2KMW0_9HEXA|nr:unnamed protein product [Allacma fusca]
MSAPRSHDEIEAHARTLQEANRAKPKVAENDRIGFGESGHFDSDIFGSGAGRFDGYNVSIAVNDEEDDDDDDDAPAPPGRSRPTFSAPAHILKDIPQADKDVDPFADHKRQTIADRQRHNDYLARGPKQIISPERVDPFQDGS